MEIGNWVEGEIGFFLETIGVLIWGALCGGVLGLEREIARKPAGLKTLIFVTVGSSLFSRFSLELANLFGGDPMRILSNIATGIGFLGAGTIVRRGDIVEGLTTASIIWTCGAIGIAVGAGFYLSSFLISVIGVTFLLVLELLEKKIIRRGS